MKIKMMTKTEMQLPDKPTIMYLRQLLVAAIYVIAGPDNRPVILGTGLDLGDALSTVRRQREKMQAAVRRAWWAPPDQTVRVIEVARHHLTPLLSDGGLIAADVDRVAATIKHVAKRLGVRLIDHDTVVARARAAIERDLAFSAQYKSPSPRQADGTGLLLSRSGRGDFHRDHAGRGLWHQLDKRRQAHQ